MKAMIKKEYLYGIRNSKFLIIGFTFMFFALSVPVMVKVLLPSLLKSQFPGLSETDLAMMMDISQTGSLINYLKNTFEIGMILISFTLSGLIASELKENTLVLSICSGRKFAPILLSKYIVNAIFIVSISFIALSTTYYYSTILFENEVTFSAIMKSALLESILLMFVVALILTIGTFTKKPIATGLFSVGLVYLLSLIGGLFKINKYVPTGLHIEANQFVSEFNNDTFITIAITIALIAVLLITSIKKLEFSEYNQR